jgi:Protein of unknown function (DUF2628)
MFCPKCGNSNENSSKFCSGCGCVLIQPTKDTSTTQSDVLHNSNEFNKAIIGPKNQEYYLPHFTHFDNEGKTNVSWHWPAFFLTLYWFLYRKMWLNALIYFVLPYLLMIPFSIVLAMVGKSADIVMNICYVLYAIATFLLPALYANALYYKHCKIKISETSLSSQDTQRQLGQLSEKGGTNFYFCVYCIYRINRNFGCYCNPCVPRLHNKSACSRSRSPWK